MSVPRHPATFRILSRSHGGLSGIMFQVGISLTLKRERRLYVTKRERCTVITTLDPGNLAKKKQQRLDLGNKLICNARVELEKLTSKPVQRFDYDREGSPSMRWPYPSDTKAFLYYTTPPGRPRIGGELRLRVTSSDDPTSFTNGSDLLRKYGQPWSRPLYIISRSYTPLYEKLREERLVSDELDAILSAFPSKSKLAYSRSQLLYTLNDTIIIDFSNAGQRFFVITEQGVERLACRGHFFDNRDSRRGTPYTGSALARFERSTLPEHKGTRTIVLRFLKIITPVKCIMPLYDGYIRWPKEGELFLREPYPVRSNSQVWSVNIDKSKGLMLRGLQLLWNA